MNFVTNTETATALTAPPTKPASQDGVMAKPKIYLSVVVSMKISIS